MRHGEILDLDGNQTQILSLENRQGEFKLVVRDFFSSDKETMVCIFASKFNPPPSLFFSKDITSTKMEKFKNV